MVTNLIQAKSILSKSALPGSDWSINPYQGCSFGCMYCYAAQMARWRHPHDTWGTYTDVKVNAAELLLEELGSLARKRDSKDFGTIFFSSVCDPYQGAEAQFGLTRQCLSVLADFNYAGSISILTKSPLVTRDLELLQRLKHVSIGLTITGLDDQASQFLEVQAPPISARLKTLEILHQHHLPTYAFVGPILPHILKRPEELRRLINTLDNFGVTEIWFEQIHLNQGIKSRLYDYLKKTDPSLIQEFDRLNHDSCREDITRLIHTLMQGKRAKLGLNQVLHHD